MGPAKARIVTPLLWVGESLDVTYRAVRTPQEAVQAINDKVPAVLPRNDWDSALLTLMRLGLSPAEAQDQIHHARYGTCLLHRAQRHHV